MMKKTVVGRPGTTMPMEPMPTASQPPANQAQRTGRDRATSGEGVSDSSGAASDTLLPPDPGCSAGEQLIDVHHRTDGHEHEDGATDGGVPPAVLVVRAE